MDLFPFETPRDMQTEMIGDVEKAIDNEGTATIHAPTGLGKTAAALTPAIEKAIEEGKKVFFLTPRHSQHQIALETVRNINEKHGKKISSTDLIGKSHLCEAKNVIADEDEPDCPRHDATFDDNHQLTEQAKKRVREVRTQNLSAEEVKKICHKVCAYQVQMHSLEHSKLIVADYFHIFHPGVRDVVLEKADIDLSDAIIIVDEAHNLPSRTRSLYSATLKDSVLKNAVTEAGKHQFHEDQQHLQQLKRKFKRLVQDKLSSQNPETRVEKKDFTELVDSFHNYEDMIVDLEEAGEEIESRQDKESKVLKVAEFMDDWNGKDEGFSRILRRTNYGEVMLKYSCLNPEATTRTPIKKSHATVLMSGTLTPTDMYNDLLGIEEENNVTREFKSPFPSENKTELVIPTLTTKYSERDESMTQKYAWYLSQSLEQIPGNAAVFFPSYKYMEEVKDQLKMHTERRIFVEKPQMDKEEKQKTLDRFKDRKDEGDAVLLGVTAGSFGEGIDFPGEILKAVFIVGLPLQRPDLETKDLINFLDEKYGKGWEYGYTYPAINRAIQAAGRCIRSKTDEGAIIFMDKRYNWSNYRKTLPKDINMKETRAPWKELEEFFSSRK